MSTTPTTAPAADPQDPVHRKRGDQINITRGEILAGTKDYDAKAQDDLVWLHGYCMEQFKGSRSALTEWLGSDWTTIYRVWLGKYGADISTFLDKVRHYRRRAELGTKTGFVKTPVTDKIYGLCNVARDQGCMVMISGGSGRCKTHTVREWKRENNHGRGIYVYVHQYGGFRRFLESLAEALGISHTRTNYDIARAVENSLDYRNVLIIDEFAHLYPSGPKNSSLHGIEFIRGLNEVTKCGVILICTDGLRDIMSGGRYGKWLEQFLGRVEYHYRIPAEFSRREIAEFCGAFTEDPDPDLINLAREIANARRGGIRELMRHLNRASQAAAKRGDVLSAKHLVAVYQAAQELVNPEE